VSADRERERERERESEEQGVRRRWSENIGVRCRARSFGGR